MTASTLYVLTSPFPLLFAYNNNALGYLVSAYISFAAMLACMFIVVKTLVDLS
jgi:hypothetical protein